MKFINFGMEAIAFQSPEFTEKMVSLFDSIMQERTGKTADNCDAAKDLIKLINKTTGMKIDIVFDTDYSPCVLPFHINPDSILGHTTLKDYYAEESKATINRLKEVKSTSFIDLKNAKVGGIFSTYEVPIYMGFFQLRLYKLTSREIVAILAHEIGHAFVAYELAFRTARTNQVLSAIAKSHAGGDQDEYKYVLKTTEEVIGLKTGVLDEIKDVKNTEVVLTVTLGNIQKHIHEQSVMGNTTYDITTFEAMADNFATRMGLGRDLVTGLEKLYRSMGAAEFNATTRVLITLNDIFTLSMMFAAGGFFLATGSLRGLLVFTFNAFILYMGLDGRDHNNVYDKLEIRFKRIKEQIIQYIKNNKLQSKDVKNALESIKHIEGVMAQISNYDGFIKPILNMLDPKSRAAINAREIQAKLETLASNDLYVKAAQLRVLD